MASATTLLPEASPDAPPAALPPAAPRAGLLGFSRAQGIALLVMVAALIVCPYFLYPQFLMKLLCFALFACAFNLLIGYVGLLSFGHAAYFGMGGYVAAHAVKVWGLTPELSILFGGLVGAGLGLVFGWIAIRRQGIYFAMITLALAQMIYFVCVQVPFTHGEDGIQSIPRGRLLGLVDLSADMTLYWFVAGLFLAGFLLIHRIVHSPFGQVLTAIRENEPRATSLGYRTDDYKLVAFVLSAGIAGVAGGAKSITVGIATLTDVHWTMSGEVVLMTLLGGLGTLFGPVLGAAAVVGMQTYLAPFGAWVTIIQGVIFVLCVLAFRAGIVGELARLLKVKL
jgi:branched-chain amino acid transport system permease protein